MPAFFIFGLRPDLRLKLWSKSGLRPDLSQVFVISLVLDRSLAELGRHLVGISNAECAAIGFKP